MKTLRKIEKCAFDKFIIHVKIQINLELNFIVNDSESFALKLTIFARDLQ